MAAGEITLRMANDEVGAAVFFERLMAAAERPVLRVCYRLLGNRHDAQDAAQEVFLKVYSNLSRLQTGRDPMPWIYQVAVNYCRDRLRRRGRPAVALDDAPLRATESDPEEQASAGQRKRLLVEGLATLGERERAALVLRELEGLETSEVARILEIAEETVRSQCSTARAKLKQFVDARSSK